MWMAVGRFTASALAKGLAIVGPLPPRDRMSVALPDELKEKVAGHGEMSFAARAAD